MTYDVLYVHKIYTLPIVNKTKKKFQTVFREEPQFKIYELRSFENETRRSSQGSRNTAHNLRSLYVLRAHNNWSTLNLVLGVSPRQT